MKFIKKINEFFNPEEEIESEYFNLHDEEGQDPEDENFYSHEDDDESSHTEEENWGDEGDSSIGSNSRISSFGDFNSEEDDYGYATQDGNFGGDDSDDYKTFNHSDEEDDIHLQHRNMISDEEFNKDDEDEEGFQEEGFVESFKAFNEKKASPAQLAARKAFANRIKGKKSEDKEDSKEDKKDSKEDKKDSKEDKKESGKGLTAAQKAIDKKNNKK